MTHMKKIGIGAIGIVVLAAIVVGFSLLGSELYRIFRTDDDGGRMRRAESTEAGGSRNGKSASDPATGTGGSEQGYERGSFGSVLVQVLGPDSEPIAKAPVVLRVAGNPPRDVLRRLDTGDNGICKFSQLPREHVGVTVDIEPYVPLSDTHVFGGSQVVFELATGAPLYGVVTDETTGQPLEGVTVRGTQRDLEPVRWNQSVTTDANGVYRFRAVPEKPLLVSFVRPGFKMVTQRDFVVYAPEGRELNIAMAPGMTVTGWVMDAVTGKPIQGATVSHGTGIFETESYEETDERGMFSLIGIPRGRISLRARADGYAPGRINLDLRNTSESERGVQIDLHRWTSVAGVVRDTVGEPVAGADVFVELDSFLFKRSSERVATTGTDGRFEANLEDVNGVVRLKATHEDFTSGTSRAVNVVAGEHVDDLVITMAVGGRIAGIVLAEGTKPLANARVNLYNQPERKVANPAIMPSGPFQQAAPRGKVTHSVTTGPDGKFDIRGIDAGVKILEVNADGFVVDRRRDLLVIDEELTGPLEIGLTRGREIAGRVVDSSSKPLRGARVKFRIAEGTGDRGMGSATTDEEGVFVLEDLGLGTYDLDFVHAGFVKKQMKSVSAGQSDISITLEKLGGIAGTVTMPQATRKPGSFEVLLYRDATLGESAPLRRKSVAAASGKFKLESIDPGTYEIAIEAPGMMPAYGSVTVVEGQVAKGVDFFLSLGGVIMGTVTDESTGAPVAQADVFVRYLGDATGARRVVGPVRTEQDGSYLVSGLLEGRYEVYATRASMATQRPESVNLSAYEQVVNLTLISGGDLKLRVEDYDGNPIEGVSVELDTSNNFVDARALRIAAKLGSQPDSLRRALSQLNLTDVTGFLQIQALPAGRYTLTLSHPDYASETVRAQVLGGQTEELRVTLQ